MRTWWNWQTRYFEVVVPKGVQVQVLPCAPSGPGIFRGLFAAEPEGRFSRVPILFPLPSPDLLSLDRPWPNSGVLTGEIRNQVDRTRDSSWSGGISNPLEEIEQITYLHFLKRLDERHSVKDGDLLLARAIASQDHLGKCVIAHPNGEQWAFDSDLMRLRFDQKRAEPEFIRHLFMTPGGRLLFLKASRKSTVQFIINTKEISALQIPVPPIPLQREFARRVTAVAALKTAQRASLAELDALFATLQHRAFRGEL
ncbi:MAG: Type restriction enzyme EcoKI specificity protein [Verrucomicrobiota bacterium]